MGIKNIINHVNALQEAKLIHNYAIGGAIAATFYIEPAATQDVDIFVHFNTPIFTPLGPIYEFLRARGGWE